MKLKWENNIVGKAQKIEEVVGLSPLYYNIFFSL